MKRLITNTLKEWFSRKDRKPLIIRGARQVGKTSLVRNFAKSLNIQLFELNFERDPNLQTLFVSNEPEKILLEIQANFKLSIDVNKSLLFLDEIQACPELLAKLRWFAEDMPQLAVIAAGSLLDFTLKQHDFSMPVGRINYSYLQPMSFDEFLMAKDELQLFNYLNNYKLTETISGATHQRLLALLREYFIVGGMPAAISSWIENQDLISINQIHHDLLATYRDDFAKYAGRVAPERLNDVLNAVPKLLGKKFKFSQVNSDIQSSSVKKSLQLLTAARVCHQVKCVDANGVPLAAEVKPNLFKTILVDIGLVSAALNLSLSDIPKPEDCLLVNQGGLAEQYVGQQLLCNFPYYIEPQLYYWMREKSGSAAEIDYIIQHGQVVIPVEVKAGKTGTLRSLHYFMAAKKLKKALRFNFDFPSVTDVDMSLPHGNKVNYQLISLPAYLIGQLTRLLRDLD